MGLSAMIRRIRADHAIDEFYMPYAAAKCGKECSNSLFSLRGTMFIEDNTVPSFTDEQLEKARQRLNAIHEKRRREAEELLCEN